MSLEIEHRGESEAAFRSVPNFRESITAYYGNWTVAGAPFSRTTNRTESIESRVPFVSGLTVQRRPDVRRVGDDRSVSVDDRTIAEWMIEYCKQRSYFRGRGVPFHV